MCSIRKPNVIESGVGSVNRTYVLMTAAHNEEAYIEKTLQAVSSQTLLPERWVIISDNSSDRTDEIVRDYAQQYGYIRLLRVSRPGGRSFGSKVRAIHQGVAQFEGATYGYIGNVDGDLSLPPDYFESLISQFEQNPRLGLAGGFVHEEHGGEFRSRRTNSAWNVAHAAQLVRRECYEAIGGYAVLEYGGEDWYAQTCARMKDWEVQAFPELHIHHYRHTGEGNPGLANWARLGSMDYDFGSYPWFEAVKCARRFLDTPYVLGGLTRFAAFAWGYVSGRPRPVPPEFARFLANEQKIRLRSAMHFRKMKTSAKPNDASTRVQLI